MLSSSVGIIAIILVGVLVTVTPSIAFANEPPTAKSKPAATQPSPILSPKNVVKIVLDALGKNDLNDEGVKTTWRFASPANKKLTGPLDKFIPLVKSPAYVALLHHQSAEVREIVVRDGEAAELAIITDDHGNIAYFVFQLSKQPDGNYKDCWMTDGVVRVEAPNAAPKNQFPQLPDGQSPV